MLIIFLFFNVRSDQNKYHEIVLDFRYFKEQDVFDSKINGSDVS